MRPQEVRERADQLVTRLEQWQQRQDRGVLARLRRGLSDKTRQEAWTVLGPYFGQTAIDCPVYETVAGCFSLPPVVPAPDIGNFGETMRQAMGKDKMKDKDEPHTRFRRLLACADSREICKHVRHAIRLAKSKEKDVNYRKLFEDLWWWNDYTKVEWAKAYWQVREESGGLSLAEFGTSMEEETSPDAGATA